MLGTPMSPLQSWAMIALLVILVIALVVIWHDLASRLDGRAAARQAKEAAKGAAKGASISRHPASQPLLRAVEPALNNGAPVTSITDAPSFAPAPVVSLASRRRAPLPDRGHPYDHQLDGI